MGATLSRPQCVKSLASGWHESIYTSVFSNSYNKLISCALPWTLHGKRWWMSQSLIDVRSTLAQIKALSSWKTCQRKFTRVFFKLVLYIHTMSPSYEICLTWMPQNPDNGKSTLAKAKVWCIKSLPEPLLFRVRSWNNGVRYMSFYILIDQICIAIWRNQTTRG